jgi:hypothetical protein
VLVKISSAYAEQIQAWQEAGLWSRGKTGIYLHRQLHKSKEYHLNNQTTKLQLIDFAAGQEQDRLTRLVDRHRPELLIIDTISSTFTETTLAKDVKEALEFILALSGEYNLCTIMVHEDNKQQLLEPQPDINNSIGLGAFTSFSRSIFTLHHEKLSNSGQVDHKEDPRILSPIKHNFVRPDPIGVWFRTIHLSGVRIEYCPVERVYARTANVRKEKKE